MVKFNLNDVETSLQRKGDWTIRLLNKDVLPPKRYIFALLQFDGNTSLWMVRFREQNLRVAFEESSEEFSEAKRILVTEIADYISRDYEIRGITSCYDIPPWLQRKR